MIFQTNRIILSHVRKVWVQVLAHCKYLRLSRLKFIATHVTNGVELNVYGLQCNPIFMSDQG